MNQCLWFLVLQEFGVLQKSILKHNCRLKQRDLLYIPLNVGGELGIESFPNVVQCGGDSGRGHWLLELNLTVLSSPVLSVKH